MAVANARVRGKRSKTNSRSDTATTVDVTTHSPATLSRSSGQRSTIWVRRPSPATAATPSVSALASSRLTALPPNSRWQLVTIASKTGWVSVIEPLITRRMSEVAVCCSSASLVSWNRRAFSIAMTAWSAKVCASAISWASNSPAAARRIASEPIAWPSRSSGTNSAEW